MNFSILVELRSYLFDSVRPWIWQSGVKRDEQREKNKTHNYIGMSGCEHTKRRAEQRVHRYKGEFLFFYSGTFAPRRSNKILVLLLWNSVKAMYPSKIVKYCKQILPDFYGTFSLKWRCQTGYCKLYSCNVTREKKTQSSNSHSYEKSKSLDSNDTCI